MPNSPQAPEASKRKPLPRWVWAGPLLAVALVVGGVAGRDAWKHRQFEMERTETTPHVIADLKVKMLWVPAGEFTMGTEEPTPWVEDLKKKYNGAKPGPWPEWKPKLVNAEETPATVVRLTKGFYLGETEVTQAQWEGVMGNNPSRRKRPQFPVETVTRDDCLAFCSKLSERERMAGRLSSTQAFRLPTEAEWEYPCRAGSRADFCFGNDETRLREYAWFYASASNKVFEVGTKMPNRWGFYDMHGNVGEWCQDYRGVYPGGKVTDPRGTIGPFYCVRGGNVAEDSNICRSAFRGKYSGGDDRNRFLGFRVVLSTVT